MHILSVPCIAMAAINFYVGFYHLFLYLKRPKMKENLPFALLCFSTGSYDIFCAGLYNSNTLQDGIFWQRLQLDNLFLETIFLMWFASIFIEKRINKIIKIFITWFILLFLIALFLTPFISPELSLTSSRPAIKNINISNLLKITYFEGEAGIVYSLGMLSSIIVYLYFLYLLIRQYLKNKEKMLTVLIISLIVYFFGVVNDIMVSSRIYASIYIAEYSFLFIILSMAYTLLTKFTGLQTEFEELNQNLEQKIEERTGEIIKLNKELKRSNTELEEFAFIASHDLQEPLRKINSYCERLLYKYQTVIDGKGSEYMEKMQNAAVRMQALINDLLTYSRVTTHAEPYTSVDLFQIVKEVLTDLEVQIEKTAGSVELSLLPVINADPTQMRQLFQNLIGNSLKFHKPGEPPAVKIYAAEEVPDGYCSIVIEDNGIGIDEIYYDKIFGVFQRLHGKSEYEGSGIGLAVCKKIAEKHVGTIRVESKPGVGTKFIVNLPLKNNAIIA